MMRQQRIQPSPRIPSHVDDDVAIPRQTFPGDYTRRHDSATARTAAEVVGADADSGTALGDLALDDVVNDMLASIDVPLDSAEPAAQVIPSAQGTATTATGHAANPDDVTAILE